MKFLIFVLFLGTSGYMQAQQPKVSKATKADTSAKVVEYKADTPATRWENGEVRNFFLYSKVSKDSIQKDTLNRKQIKAIKRKKLSK